MLVRQRLHAVDAAAGDHCKKAERPLRGVGSMMIRVEQSESAPIEATVRLRHASGVRQGSRYPLWSSGTTSVPNGTPIVAYTSMQWVKTLDA